MRAKALHDRHVQFLADDDSILFDILVDEDNASLKIMAPDQATISGQVRGGTLCIEPRTDNSIRLIAK